MRFPLQVFEAVRAAVPASMPVGVRLSATDWVDGGWDPAQSLAFARALQARGLSFLHVSSGGVSPQQKIPIGPGYQVGLAETLRRETGLPTIAVGLITEARAGRGHRRQRPGRPGGAGARHAVRPALALACRRAAGRDGGGAAAVLALAAARHEPTCSATCASACAERTAP